VADAAGDEDVVSPPNSCSRYLAIVVVLLCAYASAEAAAVIVPIIIATLVALMLAPAVRRLEQWHVPRLLGTALVLGATIAVLTSVVVSLSTPARDWLERMPRALTRIEHSLQDLRTPLRAATKASEQIQKITSDGSRAPLKVVESGPGPMARMLNATPAAIISFVATLFLTFLLLLHGDDLLRKFVTFAPHLRAKRDLVTATRQAQSELSHYVITITLINAALGAASAAALWFMDVPDPLLWGGVVALLNYAPYIGPALTAIALTVVGFYQTPQPLVALAAPGAFLVLHLIEGQWVTPHLVGRRLKLDPVVVFVALLIFGWLWGVAGMLLAVPLLTCAKIIAERTPRAGAWAKLLSY
jgi:predicted PurR-regulated permease PerM